MGIRSVPRGARKRRLTPQLRPTIRGKGRNGDDRVETMAWLGAVALALAFAPGTAQAQEKYPDHPINFIVPWGPGGGADLLARTAGKIMSARISASRCRCSTCRAPPDRPASTKLLNSPADGYTLAVLIGDTYSLLAGPHPGFTADQVIPLAIMIQQPSGYWVNTQSKWNTWQELAATAKQQTLKVAILGFGSADDITTTYLDKQGIQVRADPLCRAGAALHLDPRRQCRRAL